MIAELALALALLALLIEGLAAFALVKMLRSMRAQFGPMLAATAKPTRVKVADAAP